MSNLKKNNGLNLIALKRKLEDSSELKMNELVLKQRKWHNFREKRELIIDEYIKQKRKQLIVDTFVK